MTTGGGAPPGARRGRADPRTRRTPRDPTRARTRTRARRPSRSGARAFPRRARLGTADLFARANDGIRIRGRSRRRSSRSDPNRAPRLRARAKRRAPSVPGVRRDAPRGPRRGAGEGGGVRTGGRAPRLLEARNGAAARDAFFHTERDPPCGRPSGGGDPVRADGEPADSSADSSFRRVAALRQPATLLLPPSVPATRVFGRAPPTVHPPGIDRARDGNARRSRDGIAARAGREARGVPGGGRGRARAPRNRHARDVTSRDLCQ